MHRVAPELYNLALYALLHDVGKPILRFARRYSVSGAEAKELAAVAKDVVELVLGEKIESIASKRHDEISRTVFERVLGVALDERSREYFDNVLKTVDALAASERGLGPATQSFMESVQSVVAVEVRERAKLRYSYSHEFVPMLAPSWLLLETRYMDSVGIQAIGSRVRWSGAEERRNIAKNIFYPVLQAVERGDRTELVKRLSDILTRLAEEPVWLPIRPLLPKEIVELKAYKLNEAMEKSSYSEVVLLLLSMLREAKDLYQVSVHATRGFVDTVENILKVSASLVPSAIYWSIVPDISLYSHSKLVTALATASQLGKDRKLRLVVVDANNIQGFIAAPVKAAAASRVMRGRSLLLELVMDSLIEYALELFGGLPQANVIVSEGGTVDIAVPELEDFETRVARLRDAATKLSSFLGGLIGFTVAYSKPFTLDEVSTQRSVKVLAEGVHQPSFVDVLDSLAHALAVEKARTGVRPDIISVEGVAASDSDVEDFDSLTGEPVLRDSAREPFKLVIRDEKDLEYANALAPGKLSIGDTLSSVTHMSLAIGTVARELAAIISIHVYRYDGGLAVPDANAVEKLYEEIRNEFLKDAIVKGVLLVKRSGKQELYNENIAFVPLNPAGALYLLVSLPLREAGIHDVEKPEFANPLFEACYSIASNILEVVDRALNLIGLEGRSVRVKIRFVNAPHLFIFTEAVGRLYKDLRVDELRNSFNALKKVVQRLLGKGVDIVFGYTMLGLYHPAVYTTAQSREVKDIALIDLEEFGVIAVAKMDADQFGEVRALYSIFPSRLVTLSDLVNTIVAGKAYLKAVKIAENLEKADEKKASENFDVVPLYAGGDDVTVYGKWSHVVYYIGLLSKEIRSALPPLSLSIGVAIGDSKEPLLLLYRHAVHLLEEYAKGVRASCVIGYPYKVVYPSKPQPEAQGAQEAIYRVLPLEKPSKYYRWVNDPVASWNLELLTKILGNLIGVEKSANVANLKDELEEVKRELYILSAIAHEYEEALDIYELAKAGKVEMEEFRARVLPIEILYAYTWSRRDKELTKVKGLFENLANSKPMILQYPEEVVEGRSVEEALRLLLAAKPILDLVILALRRYDDSVKPSKLIRVEGRE
jgi:CRISPR-associated protein Csm1